MKRVNLVIIVVLGLALLLSACGGASNKLVVGTSADYPPYESKDTATNEFVGFDMDLIREIGKRMVWRWKSLTCLSNSLIAAVQEGKVDAVIAAMQKSPERLEKVDFSEGYHTQQDAFVVSGNSALQSPNRRMPPG